MSTYAVDVATLARKDVLLELRSRDTLPAMLLFVVSALVVFHFALPADASDRAEIGLFWIALIFTALLGLTRAFAAEREQACSTARAGPVDRSAIWAAKVISVVVFLALAEAVAPRPTRSSSSRWAELVAAVALADVGIASIGAARAAMAAASRSRELLLPLLFLPLAIPAVIGGVGASVAENPACSSVSSPCTTLFLRSLRGPALSMSSLNKAASVLAFAAAALLVGGIALAIFWAPEDVDQGFSQKIFTSTCRSP